MRARASLRGRGLLLRRPLAASLPTEARDYEAAVRTLMSLQSNEQAQERWRQDRLANRDLDLSEEYLLHTRAVGVEPSALSVIHVAGTKGKGSTCQFAETALRSKGVSTGVYTSPHLIEPRERIRLNGHPITRQQFAHYFWLAHERLRSNTSVAAMPTFFRFLTAMSLLVFQEERVKAVVLEVGVGGRNCPTNIIDAPVVCGISRLGYDHMDVLGPTIEDIAYAKAGIIKDGVPCYTVQQLPAAQQVLQQQADLRRALLLVLPPLLTPVLGLEGDFQRHNAALGLALARYWLAFSGAHRPSSLAEQRDRVVSVAVDEAERLTFTELKALHATRWRGRTQVVDVDDDHTLYIDGAHTAESVQLALHWFVQRSAHRRQQEVSKGGQRAERQKVVFFNCKQNKQHIEMIASLSSRVRWDAVLLVPLDGRTPTGREWELHLQSVWRDSVQPHESAPTISIAEGFEHALSLTTAADSKPADIFVTGSLYLVGQALRTLDWNVDDL